MSRKTLALKKLRAAPVPEVRPYGRNPEDWESDLPDPRKMQHGSRLVMRMPSGRPGDSYMLQVLDPEEVEKTVRGGAFFITGNFNGWTQDEMEAGTAVDVYCFTAEVPPTGVLEFRFLKDQDEEQVIAPAVDDCTRKTEAIEGPKPGLTNKWSVTGDPDSQVYIELFFSPTARSVLWLKRKA